MSLCVEWEAVHPGNVVTMPHFRDRRGGESQQIHICNSNPTRKTPGGEATVLLGRYCPQCQLQHCTQHSHTHLHTHIHPLTHSPSQPSTSPLTHTFSHILILRYTHIHTTNVKSLERSIKYVELLEPKIYLKKISIARICIDGTVMNLKAE